MEGGKREGVVGEGDGQEKGEKGDKNL